MHVYQRGYWRILQQYSAVSCHCAIANTVKFKPVQICLYYYPPLPALYLWSRYLLVFMILLISLTTSVSIDLWNMNNDNSVINNSQPYFVLGILHPREKARSSYQSKSHAYERHGARALRYVSLAPQTDFFFFLGPRFYHPLFQFLLPVSFGDRSVRRWNPVRKIREVKSRCVSGGF